MSPRTQIETPDAGAVSDEARRRIASRDHAQRPVSRGALDDATDVPQVSKALNLDPPQIDARLSTEAKRTSYFVPLATMPFSAQRRRLWKQARFRPATDAFAGPRGRVTQEDIVEEATAGLATSSPLGVRTALRASDASAASTAASACVSATPL